MSGLRQRDGKPDEGAVLIVVLLFVGVVGVLCLAITDQVRASVGNTVIVRTQQGLVVAADAGIRHAIAGVRADSTSCLNSTPTALAAPPSINGDTISLTCESVSGEASGIFGYAIVTTDVTGSGVSTSGGGSKFINGPIFSARIDDLSQDLVVKNGNLLEKSGATSCTGAGSAPAKVTFQPAGVFGYSCSSKAVPYPTNDLPTSVITALGTPNITNPSCTVYSPGKKYTGAIALDRNTYFPSGTYYFENAALSISNGAVIVGGARGSDVQSLASGCADDGADPAATGTGVKWIFGGTSTISIASSGGSIELFNRRGGTASADGTNGVTLTTVPAGAAVGWLPSTVIAPSLIFDESSGSNPNVAIHGIVDVRLAGINLDNVSNASSANFQGGLVVGRIGIQNSGSSTGLVLSIDTGTQPRVLRIVSTATSAVSGTKSIIATAVIQLQNDANRTATVLTWRSTQ